MSSGLQQRVLLYMSKNISQEYSALEHGGNIYLFSNGKN
jgi:hypothetical protein